MNGDNAESEQRPGQSEREFDLLPADLNLEDDLGRNIAHVPSGRTLAPNDVAPAGFPAFWSWVVVDEVDQGLAYLIRLDPTLIADIGTNVELAPYAEASPQRSQGESLDEQLRARGLGGVEAAALEFAAIVARSVPIERAAEMLSTTPEVVRRRLDDRTLIGVKVDSSVRVPLFQFDGEAELPGWAAVVSAFPADAHPVAVRRFVDQAHPDLVVQGRAATPRRWLLAGGDPDAVAVAVTQAYQAP